MNKSVFSLAALVALAGIAIYVYNTNQTRPEQTTGVVNVDNSTTSLSAMKSQIRVAVVDAESAGRDSNGSGSCCATGDSAMVSTGKDSAKGCCGGCASAASALVSTGAKAAGCCGTCQAKSAEATVNVVVAGAKSDCCAGSCAGSCTGEATAEVSTAKAGTCCEGGCSGGSCCAGEKKAEEATEVVSTEKKDGE